MVNWIGFYYILKTWFIVKKVIFILSKPNFKTSATLVFIPFLSWPPELGPYFP